MTYLRQAMLEELQRRNYASTTIQYYIRIVMESTAQYWRPVWETLELHWRPKRRIREGATSLSGTLHLAQAQSNRGAGGRKKDFPDAERLVKRLVAQELTLSFVPDAEQRLWRTVRRGKYQVTRNRVQLHNRLESLLEEAHIKLPASSPICWAPAPAACCRPSPTARRIRRRSPHWRTHGCGRRPTNYATPAVRARISIRYIGDW